MISVKKDFNTPPDKLSSIECKDKIRNAISLLNTHKFDSSYYAKGALAELKTIYKNKCGYCETNHEAGATFRVDHFRPKRKVKDDAVHLGYYWLGYEWSNLILSCESCNGKKSNRFPLAIGGVRVSTPLLNLNGLPKKQYSFVSSTLYQKEKALLLNPEIDEVEKELIFLPSGRVKGMTDKGIETVKVCCLNRDPLFIARKKIISENIKDIKKCLDNYLSTLDKNMLKYQLKDIFDKISTLKFKNKSYSRLGWFMFYKFDLFFINKFGSKQKSVLKKAFELYKGNNL